MPLPHSPQARSNRRLALVACTVLATMCLLVLVILQAKRAEETLEEGAAHTLRDYTGYAGRLLGAEVLRFFSDERLRILAPVSGSAHRAVPAPALDEIVARAHTTFQEIGLGSDSTVGFFRLHLGSGHVELRGGLRAALASRVADTLRALIATKGSTGEPDLIVIRQGNASWSVAYATLIGPDGRPTDIFGFSYPRARFVSAVAERVFRETPLLPTSFTGIRWNWDTTRVKPGDVLNDSLLAMRISDRSGNTMWESSSASVFEPSTYRGRTVVSTAAGGMVVESVIRPARELSLMPGVVRRAQRWSLGALLALTLLLAAVSLIALGGERLGARARRVEAMQQLALGLRHELNNALASVMLNAELLEEDAALDQAVRERMEAIVEQADRMRSVLRRLETSDRLDVVVPYLNEGYMVDLSVTASRPAPDGFGNPGSARSNG